MMRFRVLANANGGPARVIGLVMPLFFAFGFCTVLVDTIIPKLKATFALSYAEVMLTQFCFFGAYRLPARRRRRPAADGPWLPRAARASGSQDITAVGPF